MKKQYFRLFSFLIGITFIISGVLFTLVNNYKEEKRERIRSEAAIAEEIKSVYEKFYEKEKELSTYRDEVLETVKANTVFYTQIADKFTSEVIPKIDGYEDRIVEIEDISGYLKDKCTSRYSVLDANDKCDAYYINLEKSINIFVGDLEYINSKIEDYNKWTETENSSVIATQQYNKMDMYKAKKYTDYVDLNEDGTYLGKNSA